MFTNDCLHKRYNCMWPRWRSRPWTNKRWFWGPQLRWRPTPTGKVPGACVTKGSWAHGWNLARILCALIQILMMQSGQKYAQVTAAELSWDMKNCDLIASLFFKKELQEFYKIELWAHITFVKWVHPHTLHSACMHIINMKSNSHRKEACSHLISTDTYTYTCMHVCTHTHRAN